jgi:FtsH-binding integral membrane protein
VTRRIVRITCSLILAAAVLVTVAAVESDAAGSRILATFTIATLLFIAISLAVRDERRASLQRVGR